MHIHINESYSTPETVERATLITLTSAQTLQVQYQVSYDQVTWLTPDTTIYELEAGRLTPVPGIVLSYPYFRLATECVANFRIITVDKSLTTSALVLTGNNALSLSNDATTFDDFVVPATQARKGANNYPTFNETECAYEFPVSSPTHVLYMNVQLPHWWREGTRVYPHVHWIQSRNEIPVFKLTYRWFNNGATIPAWSDPYIMNGHVCTYPSGSIGQISNNATGVDGTGKTLSSIFQIKFYRDDSAYAATLYMTSFDLHLERNDLGSRQEYIK